MTFSFILSYSYITGAGAGCTCGHSSLIVYTDQLPWQTLMKLRHIVCKQVNVGPSVLTSDTAAFPSFILCQQRNVKLYVSGYSTLSKHMDVFGNGGHIQQNTDSRRHPARRTYCLALFVEHRKRLYWAARWLVESVVNRPLADWWRAPSIGCSLIGGERRQSRAGWCNIARWFHDRRYVRQPHEGRERLRDPETCRQFYSLRHLCIFVSIMYMQ